MIVFPAGVVEYLTKKYGERFYKALISYNPENVSSLAVDRKDILEISAAVKGSKSVYACFLSKDEVFCSCTDQTIRKTVCKHIFCMLFGAIEEGSVKLDEVVELLLMFKNPLEKSAEKVEEAIKDLGSAIMFPDSSKTGKEE